MGKGFDLLAEWSYRFVLWRNVMLFMLAVVGRFEQLRGIVWTFQVNHWQNALNHVSIGVFYIPFSVCSQLHSLLLPEVSNE